MTGLWLLPALVTAVGLCAVVVTAGRSAEEGRRLGDELRRLRGLRPLVLELQAALGPPVDRPGRGRHAGRSA